MVIAITIPITTAMFIFIAVTANLIMTLDIALVRRDPHFPVWYCTCLCYDCATDISIAIIIGISICCVFSIPNVVTSAGIDAITIAFLLFFTYAFNLFINNSISLRYTLEIKT